jgi:hypothetical protein
MVRRLAMVVGAVSLLACGAAERESAPAPELGGVQVTVPLPAAMPAEACPAREQRSLPAAGSVPGLALLGQPRTAADALPEVSGMHGHTWLPATTVQPTEARRAGAGRFAAEVHLVPTLGVRTDGRCDPDAYHDDGPGACLTAGTGRAVTVRCFANAAIWSGRAVSLTEGHGGRPSEVHGVVPDGVERVRLSWAGGSALAAPVENVFEVRLPGVDAGATVTLAFFAAGQPNPCEPSAELLGTVPALLGEPPPHPPPEQLAAVVGVDQGLVERWARIWDRGDELTYWLVPQLRCGVVTDNDRACVAVAAEFVEGAVCASEADIAERGVSDWYPIGGRPLVAGFAPRGATAAVVNVPGYEQVFPVRDGVFAGALREGVRMDRPDAYLLTFIK